MKENKDGLKSNFAKVDAHQISQAEYDEIPELPKSFFTEGQLYRDGKPVERRIRGKQKKPVKKQLTIRLDAEVAEAFRVTGVGWQTRINNALKDWLREHRP